MKRQTGFFSGSSFGMILHPINGIAVFHAFSACFQKLTRWRDRHRNSQIFRINRQKLSVMPIGLRSPAPPLDIGFFRYEGPQDRFGMPAWRVEIVFAEHDFVVPSPYSGGYGRLRQALSAGFSAGIACLPVCYTGSRCRRRHSRVFAKMAGVIFLPSDGSNPTDQNRVRPGDRNPEPDREGQHKSLEPFYTRRPEPRISPPSTSRCRNNGKTSSPSPWMP